LLAWGCCQLQLLLLAGEVFRLASRGPNRAPLRVTGLKQQTSVVWRYFGILHSLRSLVV
jgi:hypothetical protein